MPVTTRSQANVRTTEKKNTSPTLPLRRSKRIAAKANSAPTPKKSQCTQHREFVYSDPALPSRRSKRIAAKANDAVRAIVGAEKVAEWCSVASAHLNAIDDAKSYHGADASSIIAILHKANKLYKYLLESPVTPLVMRHNMHFRRIAILKAYDIMRHCSHIHRQIECRCSYYANMTPAQEASLTLAKNSLVILCMDFLCMKY